MLFPSPALKAVILRCLIRITQCLPTGYAPVGAASSAADQPDLETARTSVDKPISTFAPLPVWLPMAPALPSRELIHQHGVYLFIAAARVERYNRARACSRQRIWDPLAPLHATPERRIDEASALRTRKRRGAGFPIQCSLVIV